MVNSYKIRAGRPEDAEEMTRLAFRSKAYWGYPDEWLSAWNEELTVTVELLKNSISCVVESNGKIIAFWNRPVIETEEVTAGLLSVAPEYIRQGYGRMLWKSIKQEALNRGISSFTIEADPNALPFYLKLGASVIREQESKLIPGRILPVVRFKF